VIAREPEQKSTTAAELPALAGVLKKTAHASVLDALRRAILGGVIEAGTPLIQSELSARLGVSKTPIREAIRDLAAEGLIDFDSYRSSVVHTPTLDEAREIYDLRLVLEPIAVRQAVRNISHEAIARADALTRDMRRTRDVSDWLALNHDFHDVLTTPAGASRLLSIIEGLRNAAAMQIAWSFKASGGSLMEGANADHDLIVNAYRRRDPDAAVEATEHHLRATLETVERFERERAGGADGDGDRNAAAAPFEPAA
jgi:DNA-binding GntR family transcriptional regulator